jgi:hypothetical protein
MELDRASKRVASGLWLISSPNTLWRKALCEGALPWCRIHLLEKTILVSRRTRCPGRSKKKIGVKTYGWQSDQVGQTPGLLSFGSQRNELFSWFLILTSALSWGGLFHDEFHYMLQALSFGLKAKLKAELSSVVMTLVRYSSCPRFIAKEQSQLPSSAAVGR